MTKVNDLYNILELIVSALTVPDVLPKQYHLCDDYRVEPDETNRHCDHCPMAYKPDYSGCLLMDADRELMEDL